ncbi:MAG TPA: hypothetical protein VKA48_05355, partial [Gammaproteobacteria bacterium]|nr:hypothetical protein [Gammaproteobacteria bacterium]
TRWTGRGHVRYSRPGRKHFGPMMYGENSPVVRPFVDPAAGALTGNAIFEGWETYASETLDPGDPYYGQPMECLALYLWRHRSPDNLRRLRQLVDQGQVDADLSQVTEADAVFGYGTRPDWQGTLHLAGPLIPGSRAVQGVLTHRQEATAYALLVPGIYYQDHQTAGTLTAQVGQGMTLALDVLVGRQQGTPA